MMFRRLITASLFFFLTLVSVAQVNIHDELDLAFEDVDRISSLERGMKKSEADNTALQKQNQELDKRCGNLKNQIEQIERIAYRQRVDLKIKEEEIAELKNTVGLKEEELNRLIIERDSLASEVQKVNERLLELEYKINALTSYFVKKLDELRETIRVRREENLKRANSVAIDGYDPINHSSNISKNPKLISFELYYYPLPDSPFELGKTIDMEVSLRQANGEAFIVYPIALYRNVNQAKSDEIFLSNEYVFYENKNIGKSIDFKGRLEKGVYYHIFLRCQELELNIGRFKID